MSRIAPSTHLSALTGWDDPDRRADVLQHLWCGYHAAVVHHCTTRGLQPADAEDVASRVLLGVGHRLDHFVRSYRRDDPRRQFRPFLFTCARNAICDHYEERGRTGTGLPADAPAPALAEAIAAELDECDLYDDRLRDAVRRARERVSARTWGVFVERVVHGRAYADIADGTMTVDAAEAAVRRVTRLVRALYNAGGATRPEAS